MLKHEVMSAVESEYLRRGIDLSRFWCAGRVRVQSLPRRAVGGLRFIVPVNSLAFRLCSTDSYETLINENFSFVATF